jgi:hypothetical protein
VTALSGFGVLLLSRVLCYFFCIYLFYFLSISGTLALYSGRFIHHIYIYLPLKKNLLMRDTKDRVLANPIGKR